MIKMEIINRLNGFNLESNLVYPLDKGYYYDIPVDKKEIKNIIYTQISKFMPDDYNKKRALNHRDMLDISNKYAVKITANSGNEYLIVNHDGNYYVINK